MEDEATQFPPEALVKVWLMRDAVDNNVGVSAGSMPMQDDIVFREVGFGRT